MDPMMFAGGAPTGAVPDTVLDELQKALTMGYGTDVSTLTGGGALRVQSLDKAMQATIQENKHFRLFNRLPKPSATATVDEWTEQSSIGGFLGGSTNTETGIIPQATGVYNRRVGQVKYLMAQRQVSFVATLGTNIVEAQTVEEMNGAKQLLTDAEYLSFDGDSTVVPTEFDGIFAQMNSGVTAGQVDGAAIIDARAQSVQSIALFNQAAATIAGYGNYGTPTDFFLSMQAQADLDTGLQSAFRVALDNRPNSVEMGTPVRGVVTSHGDIAMQPDVFVLDAWQRQPFEVLNAASVVAGIAPTSVTAATATDATSLFTTANGNTGNYYYYVTGVNASGQSTGVVTAQVAVGSAHNVALTITRSAGAQETGYVIYRSRLNGPAVVAGSIAGAGSDFRQLGKIGVAGATTTFTDRDFDVPGTTRGYVLDLQPGDTAMTWRQLLPMMKFNLFPTNAAIVPWAQLLFGYLRISKRRHHAVIKNILPTSYTWKPYSAT